jgi:hypothetical protein
MLYGLVRTCVIITVYITPYPESLRARPDADDRETIRTIARGQHVPNRARSRPRAIAV